MAKTGMTCGLTPLVGGDGHLLVSFGELQTDRSEVL